MEWVSLKKCMPTRPGEYLVYLHWMEPTEEGPKECRLLGVALYDGKVFRDVMTLWGSMIDGQKYCSHWAYTTDPVDEWCIDYNIGGNQI